MNSEIWATDKMESPFVQMGRSTMGPGWREIAEISV